MSEIPRSGSIWRRMLGHLGLTTRSGRFCTRIVVDPHWQFDAVGGSHIINTLSSTCPVLSARHARRLSFGVNMGLRLDTYLIDKMTPQATPVFDGKAQGVFRERMENAGAIFFSHSSRHLRKICQTARCSTTASCAISKSSTKQSGCPDPRSIGQSWGAVRQGLKKNPLCASVSLASRELDDLCSTAFKTRPFR